MKNLFLNLAFVFFLALPMAACAEDAPSAQDLTIVTQDGARHAFKVEIADTPAAREQGLMFRKQMDAGHGMLFKMDTVKPVAFWMKNTLIPLDIVFIQIDGTILSVVTGKPEDLTPLQSGGPVSGVLEINGGRAAELNIKPGDKVVFPFFDDTEDKPEGNPEDSPESK